MSEFTYINENINGHPLLTKEEEKSLVLIIYKGKNPKLVEAAKIKLINSNLRLVAKHANYYTRHSSMSNDDMFSAGKLGLIKAVERFDISRNCRFTTYATGWIKQAILEAIYASSTIIHVPAHINCNNTKYKKMLNTSSRDTIQKETGWSDKTIEKFKLAGVPIVSLQQKVPDLHNKGSDVEFGSTLSDDTILPPNKLLMQRELPAIIRGVIESCDHIQRDIIFSRFFKDETEDFATIGKRHNCSGEYIRQTWKKLLRHLKYELAPRI